MYSNLCKNAQELKILKTIRLPKVGSRTNGSRIIFRMEGTQRRAALWILNKRCGELTYVERLKALNLLPLAYDREIRDLKGN